MFRLTCVAMMLVAVAVVATAEEKKNETKLKGTWVRDSEAFQIKFEFEKSDALKLTLDNSGNGLVISGSYTIESDGTVKVTIQSAEKKGDFSVEPKKGDHFSFKWKADGKKAKLFDFTTDNESENAKKIMEGEYSEQK